MIAHTKYGFLGMMKKLVLVISILITSLLSGCNKTMSIDNYVSDIKEKIVEGFTSASKSSENCDNK